MLPKGGNMFWGGDDGAPDDGDNTGDKSNADSFGSNSDKNSSNNSKDDELSSPVKKSTCQHTHGKIVTFMKKRFTNGVEDANITVNLIDNGNNTNTDKAAEEKYHHYTMDDALELLYSTASTDFSTMIRTNYSNGVSTSKKQLQENAKDHTKWGNPLETQLPNGKYRTRGTNHTVLTCFF
jgi:phospholipid:diacylglycerol acyltransferase